MNYYERYCGDYQRDTAHLSLTEHGAFTMLLDTYYSTEKPLGFDWVSLYRICRAMDEQEQAAVRRVADEFFPIAADGLRHNKRADELIESTRAKLDAKRENGKKGGRPKKPKEPSQNLPETEGKTETETKSETEQEPTANLTESSPTPTPTPVVNQEKLLSGVPDDADADDEREPQLDMSAADPVAEVIGYLNDRAGTAFRLVESNARLVRARLREGATVSDMRAVIDAKSREWPSGDKMRKYLRPSTLFGAENFAQYVGQLVASTPPETDAPFWVRAGFKGKWDALNAGVTEGNVRHWRAGRPLIKIPGANVEPWPEGTYERS
ncbi:DUF1376 domain-containing protein [Burkholderia gladioli]|uniref:DUF1376 domain-containing protein n=1 Tax=Burkholderia gladioli TaxID=28095 RepID=UPI00163E09D2|nr:DUF1376 domain-containing protein [Burkholderia gladioli]